MSMDDPNTNWAVFNIIHGARQKNELPELAGI